MKLICKGGCAIRTLKQWITAVLLVIMLPISAVQAQTDVPEELYLAQAQSRSCTLCSATMMLRSCFYINGDDRWEQVTEGAVGATAWTSDGLYWNWSYAIDDNTLCVAQTGCTGITAESLKEVLDNHPEGIVLYCGGSAPHAVFLTGYEGDTFYCADPAWGYSGRRIPLTDSLLGDRHGSQSNILSAVSAYWYIASHNIEDRSYLAGCLEYSTDCRIRVRWDGYAMSLPCTAEQAGDAEQIFRIHSGEYFTAQAFLLNSAGQYWYRVGEDLYISAADAQCVSEQSPECGIQTQPPDVQEQDVVPLLLFPIIEQKMPQKY